MLTKKSALTKNQLRLLAAAMGIEIAVEDIAGFKDRHGWQTELARRMGLKSTTTIHEWIRRGVVPSRQRLKAKEMGIPDDKWFRDPISKEMILNAVLRGDPDRKTGSAEAAFEVADRKACIEVSEMTRALTATILEKGELKEEITKLKGDIRSLQALCDKLMAELLDNVPPKRAPERRQSWVRLENIFRKEIEKLKSKSGN